MTAPVYEDHVKVDGFMLASFHKIIKEAETDSLVQRVATAAVKLWDERDKARETAALQDGAIHRMGPHIHELELIWKAVQTFQELGYKSGYKEINGAIMRMVRFRAKGG